GAVYTGQSQQILNNYAQNMVTAWITAQNQGVAYEDNAALMDAVAPAVGQYSTEDGNGEEVAAMTTEVLQFAWANNINLDTAFITDVQENAPQLAVDDIDDLGSCPFPVFTQVTFVTDEDANQDGRPDEMVMA